MLKSITRLSVAAGLCFAASVSFAQPAAPAAKPQFEVASIKQNPTDIVKLSQQLVSGGAMPKIGVSVNGAQADYNLMSLSELIQEAYQLKPYQITGPDWMTSITAPRFDIAAKMPTGASTKEAARPMLQALLEQRFKMVARRENKEQTVLALVEAKGGHKMKPAVEEDSAAAAAAANAPAKTGEVVINTNEGQQARMTQSGTGVTMKVPGRGAFNIQMDPATRDIRIEATSATMPEFAQMLSQYSRLGGGGKQVVDMTGLTGKYQVALTMAYADILAMAQKMGVNVPAEASAAGAPANAASDPSGAGFLSSVNSLGLKLEQRKAPVDQLIIESIAQQPTEN